MAQSIIYKGQKYVRVDSVRPRTRRVRVDGTFTPRYGSSQKRALDDLRKAGVKVRDSYTTNDNGSNYEYARAQTIFKITCLDKTSEFRTILAPYLNSIIDEVIKETYGGLIDSADVKVVKQYLKDTELYVECKAKTYLSPIDDDY